MSAVEAMDLVKDLQRWNERIKALPEPLAYIVLDHGWGPQLPHVEGRDAKGKKYVLVSPAVLDEVCHVKASAASAPGVLAKPFGIPIYRLENMPEGWPE